MELHRVTIDSEWRPDHAGVRHRRYIAECVCGFSAGWTTTRTEAAQLGDEHRSVAAVNASMVRAAVAAVNASMVRAAAARADHPGPAA
jgi:hypothetical protein